MKYEICVIGGEALLFPFLQFGFATFTPSSEKALREYLAEITDKNYGIIYIEDSYCNAIKDILDKHKNELTPIFIPIGKNENGSSYSEQVTKELMAKAIGQNIL